MRATSLFSAGTVALMGLLACARPNDHGDRYRTDGPAPPAGEPADAPPAPPPADPPIADPAGPADAGAAVDAGAETAPGGAAAMECTPGVRACRAGDPRSTRQCSETGQWTDGPACATGSSCSGGACVCDEGACEDGVLQEFPGYAQDMFGRGPFLHLTHVPSSGASAIHSLDVRSGLARPPLIPAAGYDVGISPSADASGTVYWCRFRPLMQMVGDLMRGPAPLEPGPCTRPLVSDRHIYFGLSTRNGYFRRALDRPGRQQVFAVAPEGIAVTATHIYFSTVPETGGVVLLRTPVDELTPVQMLGRRAASTGRMFHEIAVDDTHVYVSYADQVLRLPREGGSTFDEFWSHRGPEIEAIRLTDTHVYWSTVTFGLETCVESAIWRRSKLRDDRATLLARRSATCPGGLAIVDGHVYAAFSSYPGPSQILRLRP
jgi:hypothetical protein